MHMRKVKGLVQEQVTGARNVARAAYGTDAGAGARAADVTGAEAAAARVADVKSAGAAAASCKCGRRRGGCCKSCWVTSAEPGARAVNI